MKPAVAILFCTVCTMVLFTTCGDNREDLHRVMFFSSNWGDDSIKITDDILSLEDGATAAPREILLEDSEILIIR